MYYDKNALRYQFKIDRFGRVARNEYMSFDNNTITVRANDRSLNDTHCRTIVIDDNVERDV